MSESASEAPTNDQGAPATDAAKTGDDKPADLGEAGKKAIDAMKAERDAARRDARAGADAIKRLAEIEEANKTEAQRTADRLKAAETDAANARRDALRFRIASKYKIDDEDADLFLTGADEESLTKQAERLVAREATRRADAEAAEAEAKRRGNHVPREGTTSPAVNKSDHEFVTALFGGG